MKASAKESVRIMGESSERRRNKAGISPHSGFWKKIKTGKNGICQILTPKINFLLVFFYSEYS
jgi:hypothetical protein